MNAWSEPERSAARSAGQRILELSIQTDGRAPMIDQLYDDLDARGRKAAFVYVLSIAANSIVGYAAQREVDPLLLLDRLTARL